MRANAEVIVSDFLSLTVEILEQQAASYRREPTTIAGLLPLLELTGLPQFTAEVRRHIR